MSFVWFPPRGQILQDKKIESIDSPEISVSLLYNEYIQAIQSKSGKPINNYIFVVYKTVFNSKCNRFVL